MTWFCPVCNGELGDYNGWCEYCQEERSELIYNPDKYYIREVCIYSVIERVIKMEEKEMSQEEFENYIDSNEKMTPQEKLFSKLFHHETTLVVRDMDRLTLRAHIEELSKIAFEAKVRLHAGKAEDDRRGKKDSNDGKVKGFERSVNTDEATTDAINKIKERQKRLTKAEKIQAGLEKLGISSTDAAKLMTAGTILGRIKQKAAEIDGAGPKPEPIKVFNPFEKK